MKILLAASEAVPFCKTGGMADVVGTLGKKLGDLGHDVCLFLPKYRTVQSSTLQGGSAIPIEVSLGASRRPALLRYMQYRSVSACFIDEPSFYDREGLYGQDGKDHPDNDLRYIFFCRGVLEGAKALGFKPDIIHAHDWQAGLIPAYLKNQYKNDSFFSSTASVMTIHNMAYQGNFPKESLAAAGFKNEDFTPSKFEYYGQFSFLKAGLLYADWLTTVSSKYAREIQESSERGFGLEGLLSLRGPDLTGILNGIDTEMWNSEKDSALPKKFGIHDVKEGKAVCKKSLQAECGLKPDAKIPLITVISRLDYQKGLDLAIAALEARLSRCQLAVLGDGDPTLSSSLAALSRRHPGSVFFRYGFDEGLAHRLYGGADIFLMPSRFEPCGLGQMIAMRYGGVPVTSRTGGLADTVFETAQGSTPANGFTAAPGDVEDLGRALDRAFDLFGKPEWAQRVSAAISGDYSWDKSVPRYLEAYERARRAHKRP